MAIKVIVELQAKPGGRDELARVIEGLVRDGAGQPGFLGSARFEVVDNADALVEIATWESVEARAKHMQDAAARNLYAPVAALLAAPFKVTILRQLS